MREIEINNPLGSGHDIIVTGVRAGFFTSESHRLRPGVRALFVVSDGGAYPTIVEAEDDELTGHVPPASTSRVITHVPGRMAMRG